MNVKIFPSRLNGTVSVPPSKSIAHRALICAALSNGNSFVHPVDNSQDMRATIGALEALGAEISKVDEKVLIAGIKNSPSVKKAEIDCIESGSTLRF